MRIHKSTLLVLLLVFTLACSTASLTGGGNGNGSSAPTVEPPMPASGTILFQDDFESGNTGWDRVTGADGIEDYDNGVYRIQVTTPEHVMFGTPGKDFKDTRIEVDTARIAGPDSNRAGLLCRFQTVNKTANFYFFIVTSDGFFGIGRTTGEQSVLLGMNELTQNPNIKTGLAINHLRADCQGNMLSFYVNGFLVGQTTDDTLTHGDVGLIAGTFKDGAVDVIFDQFIVLQP